MSNVVPNGWLISSITEMTSLKHGYQFRTPDFSDDGVQVVKIGQVVGSGKIDLSNCDNVRQEVYRQKKEFELKAGDIVMSLTGNIGRVGVVPTLSQPLLQNYRVGLFKPVLSRCDVNFLPHLLGSQFVTEQLLDKSNSTAQANFGKSDLDQVSVLCPPLPEQQKIAVILTSVDEVIEKTQAQIDKLKDLKTGMMQELLTEGVSDGGKRHTEFKDSPVGRVPVGWEAILLDTVAKRGSGHTPNKLKPEYWNGGIKWVSLTDSSQLDKLYINDTVKKISQLGIENSSATPHPVGTVVMARDAGIGKSAIITDVMAVSQHFMAWVCGNQLDNYYLYYLLQHWKPRFETIAMGSTIKTIGLPFFKKLFIPVPPLSEQQKISASLRSVDESIFKLENKNTANKSIKKALMQDLLTGKVRVNTEQVNTEVAAS